MLKIMDKKIFTILCRKVLLISTCDFISSNIILIIAESQEHMPLFNTLSDSEISYELLRVILTLLFLNYCLSQKSL